MLWDAFIGLCISGISITRLDDGLPGAERPETTKKGMNIVDKRKYGCVLGKT